jgi:hypothetical protein
MSTGEVMREERLMSGSKIGPEDVKTESQTNIDLPQVVNGSLLREKVN